MAQAPIAYVPIGTIEYHGPHLPLGTDLITAHAVCSDAAGRGGGVVLPALYLANGCLDLPHTLTFTPQLVAEWVDQTVAGLHHRGFTVVIVLTGHGPLDLIHLLKRVTRRHRSAQATAYGLCYLELTAARLAGPVTGEPTVIDHASTVETSWVLDLAPELVDLTTLSEDPQAVTAGVYGRNPRFTADAGFAAGQRAAAADLLASRAQALCRGEPLDDEADLRTYVRYGWPEPLVIDAVASTADGLVVELRNPGRASRYVTAVTEVTVSGAAVPLAEGFVCNTSPGETGERFALAELSPERGIYLRRGQAATLTLPAGRALPAAGASGSPAVALSIELGGVLPTVVTT